MLAFLKDMIYPGWFLFLIISFFIFVVWAGIYTWIRIVQEKEKARAKTFRRMVQLKVRGMQCQMDPHFTFNALNSIQSYMLEGKTESAIDYLTDFALILRKNYDNITKDYISLADEVDYLQHYIKLEEMRFSDKFSFELEIDPNMNLHGIHLPPMLIQPFVENSIKHGLTMKTGKGVLKLSFSQEDDKMLNCVIEDDGIGRSQSKAIETNRHINFKGNAALLTWDRIKLLNHIEKDDSKYEVVIKDLHNSQKEPVGTRVLIRIPVKD